MKHAKRILLVVTQAHWGGVQEFLVHLAKDLKAEGREVLLACGGDGDLWTAADRAGIPTRRLAHLVQPIAPFEDLRAVFELKRLINEFKPDAIHLNSSKAGVVGSLAARLSKTKPWVVYRIGGGSFLEPMSAFKKWIYRVSEQWTAGLKDIIITVHPGDEKLAKRYGIRPRHTRTTVANGLDVPNFIARLKTREAARAELGIPEHAFVFGSISNAYATKGLHGYLNVLAKVLDEDRNTTAVIIGDGPEFASLQVQKSALGLERVVLAGWRNAASTFIPAFDVFVLPSRKEGMPWVLLEAMAAGIPSIATDVGACRWMLTGSKFGDAGLIIPPEDPLSLYEVLRRLRTNPAEREALARGARQSVTERFSWQTTFNGHRDALDRA